VKEESQFLSFLMMNPIGSEDKYDQKDITDKFLLYIRDENPFTTSCEDEGKVIKFPGCQKGTAQHTILKLMEEYPHYIAFGEEKNTFDRTGYTRESVKILRKNVTLAPNWYFYGAIGLSVITGPSNQNQLCDELKLYCDRGNLSYSHDKIGFQYRPPRDAKGLLKLIKINEPITNSPVYYNFYAGGLIHQITPHEPLTTIKDHDLDSRYLLGIEASAYIQEIVEVNMGVQRLIRLEGETTEPFYVYYLNVSVPLEEYLSALSK